MAEKPNQTNSVGAHTQTGPAGSTAAPAERVELRDLRKLPNLLSIVRLLLIPVFISVYLRAEEQPWFYISAGILLLSGLTDLLDGLIARRFHLITPLGKILDPLADKLTQASVCICLAVRIPQLWMILVIFITKEVLMLLAGAGLYRRHRQIDGAKWFGKLYTVVFYLFMLLIVAVPSWSMTTLIWMLCVVGVFMLFAFGMYLPVFWRIVQKDRENARQARAGREKEYPSEEK